MTDTDSIILYCDKHDNMCQYKTRKEYKLEKSGIPAYKLIFENENGNEDNSTSTLLTSDARYVIIVNKVNNGTMVGLLICLTTNFTFNKDQVVFSITTTNDLQKQADEPIVELIQPIKISNKTLSVFDKYNVECKKK
nr:TLP20 [Darna trima granulovirus]